MTTRDLMNIALIDEDSNLPVEHSLVASFENVLTEDSAEVTIQQLLVDQDIKTILAKHNKVREGIINKSILNRTGNKVMLEPVTIKNLTWKIK